MACPRKSRSSSGRATVPAPAPDPAAEDVLIPLSALQHILLPAPVRADPCRAAVGRGRCHRRGASCTSGSTPADLVPPGARVKHPMLMPMLMLVAYDVNTETAAGRRRLRRVARACLDWPACAELDVRVRGRSGAMDGPPRHLRARIAEIDPEADSLRFYRLARRDAAASSAPASSRPSTLTDRCSSDGSGPRANRKRPCAPWRVRAPAKSQPGEALRPRHTAADPSWPPISCGRSHCQCSFVLFLNMLSDHGRPLTRAWIETRTNNGSAVRRAVALSRGRVILRRPTARLADPSLPRAMSAKRVSSRRCSKASVPAPARPARPTMHRPAPLGCRAGLASSRRRMFRPFPAGSGPAPVAAGAP